MGKSSGATFSKIQVDIASNCCQMAKNDRILADERPLEHFLAILAHFMPIYTRIFENGTARLRCPSGVSRALFCRSETISKVGNIKIMSASSPFFFSPLSPPFSFLCFRVFWTPTRKHRKEKGGERGEKKKGLLALIIFILPTLEIVSERQKSARDTPLGHLNRAVPFSKIRVYNFSPFHANIYPDF